jgi:hypothetical protein
MPQSHGTNRTPAANVENSSIPGRASFARWVRVWVVLGYNERLKLLENYWLADHARNPPDTRAIIVMDMCEQA